MGDPRTNKNDYLKSKTDGSLGRAAHLVLQTLQGSPEITQPSGQMTSSDGRLPNALASSCARTPRVEHPQRLLDVLGVELESASFGRRRHAGLKR